MKITFATPLYKWLELAVTLNKLNMFEDTYNKLEAKVQDFEQFPFTITYGERIDLMKIQTLEDMLFIPQEVLHKRNREYVLKRPFWEVFTFGINTLKKIKEMNDRDATHLAYNPSVEELEAGYNELKFGRFGIIDSIAQRMRLSHDEVMNIPELRIYAMLKKDLDTFMYKRRYDQVVASKQKHK